MENLEERLRDSYKFFEEAFTLQDALLDSEMAYRKFGVIIQTVSPQVEGHSVLGFFDLLEPNVINVSSELAVQSFDYGWFETALHELGHQKKLFRNPHSDGSTYDEEQDNRRWLYYTPHVSYG